MATHYNIYISLLLSDTKTRLYIHTIGIIRAPDSQWVAPGAYKSYNIIIIIIYY